MSWTAPGSMLSTQKGSLGAQLINAKKMDIDTC